MKKKLILISLIFLLVIGGGLLVVRTDFVKGLALDVSYPFMYAFDKVSGFFDYISQMIASKTELIQENNNLQQKLELLKAQIIYLKRLEDENAELKKQLNVVNRYPNFRLITGRIIGYSPDNWSEYVVINIGEKDGIKEGDIVVSNGYLFGQVYQVGKFSSSVILISDKNFRISARCRKTREFVLFQGKNEKEGQLIFVKPEQDIRIGDIVETSGVENKIPEGIPIGEISSVSYEEGNFYKNVSVSLKINPFKTEYVVVFIPAVQNEDKK